MILIIYIFICLFICLYIVLFRISGEATAAFYGTLAIRTRRCFACKLQYFAISASSWSSFHHQQYSRKYSFVFEA